MALSRPRALPPAPPEHVTALQTVVQSDEWHNEHPGPLAGSVAARLVELHSRLADIGFEFGHRTFLEAIRFAAIAAACGMTDEDEVFDWLVMAKVLPRIHGSRRQLESFLADLAATAAGADPTTPLMPLTVRKTRRMLALVQANQFVSFAE